MAPVTPGQWQHIELVRGAGVTSLWVDGTLVGSDPDFPTPSDDFSIGAAKRGDGTADGAFLGAIDNVRLTGAEDTDGDGLPNAWETQHNLNPTSEVGDDGATDDPDQDTFDNQAEFAAGSDPRNAASVPRDTDADGLADAWETAVFGNLSRSGSAFLYTTGGDWRFHINGAGDRITGGTVTLGAWQRLELRCVAGEVQLHVDGALVGTTTEFPASLADDFSIAAAKNGSGGPDGRFVGAIDNVVLKAIGSDADGDGLPDDWETANGLDAADASGVNGADGDGDGDGRSNYAEWAFGGHPALADAQATAGAVQLVDFLGTPYLHATFPCRTGAVFDGGVPSVAEVDGIRYAIEASADLAGPALSVVEVTPALASQLPLLPAGYEWRTFRLTDSAGVRPAAFIRVSATKP